MVKDLNKKNLVYVYTLTCRNEFFSWPLLIEKIVENKGKLNFNADIQ